MADEKTAVSRRTLLKAVAVAGATGAASVSARDARAQQHAHGEPGRAQSASWSDTLFFFNDPEARFVESAVDRLIPPDDEWTGAAGAGVLSYIDRQLASAYGNGARMYLAAPWNPDAPSQQGYQLRLSPAELYRIGIEECRQVCQQWFGREFWEVADGQRDEFLKRLEQGSISLTSMPAPVFFETLLANTIEGFFADPAYGGNRDMVGWRMVGFPGAYAQYLELVDAHGVHYARPPIGIADHTARHRHIAAHGAGER